MLDETKKVSNYQHNNQTHFFSVQSDFIVWKWQEFENHAAEVDGAKWKLFQKLNNIVQMKATMGSVTKAEEHAEELSRVAAEFQP